MSMFHSVALKWRHRFRTAAGSDARARELLADLYRGLWHVFSRRRIERRRPNGDGTWGFECSDFMTGNI